MPSNVSWHTLLEELDELPDDVGLITPLLHDTFRVTGVQGRRIVITLDDTRKRHPLQRNQSETLHCRIQDSNGAFEPNQLPPDTDPYPAVLNLHSRFEVNKEQGDIIETETETGTQLLSDESAPTESDRAEPDEISAYPGALLLIDVLERQDVSDSMALGTEALMDLYTLYSDVQQNADELRQDIANMLLDRLHHDQPVHGQCSSIRRTLHRSHSLKDEEGVLITLEGAGINRGHVMGVGSGEVNEALGVAELSEMNIYEADENEHVQKAEVGEDVKESRPQGSEDRLTTSNSAESNEFRQEIETLEEHINDLTSFNTGTQIQGQMNVTFHRTVFRGLKYTSHPILTRS